MKRAAVELLLPEVFRRTIRPENPLSALLEVMEAQHAPAEAALAGLDATFDPRRAPEEFVPFLAGWLDLERLFDDPYDDFAGEALGRRPISTGLGRLRELIAWASYLSQWRGTARGLRRFLEVATGVTGFVIDEAARPFHIRVRAPRRVQPHEPLLRRIIELEKPAYVTFDLDFGP